MIVGLGMDMASLSRIGKCLERFGAQFCRRILTEAERELLPEAPPGVLRPRRRLSRLWEPDLRKESLRRMWRFSVCRPEGRSCIFTERLPAGRSFWE